MKKLIIGLLLLMSTMSFANLNDNLVITKYLYSKYSQQIEVAKSKSIDTSDFEKDKPMIEKAIVLFTGIVNSKLTEEQEMIMNEQAERFVEILEKNIETLKKVLDKN